MSTQADPTFADLADALADPAGDHEPTARVEFALDDYSAGLFSAPTAAGTVVLECGREAGRWRLRALHYRGEDREGCWDTGDEPLLELADQDAGPDPLALLRSLLGGGTGATGARLAALVGQGAGRQRAGAAPWAKVRKWWRMIFGETGTRASSPQGCMMGPPQKATHLAHGATEFARATMPGPAHPV